MDPSLALAQFATLTGGAALIVALVEVIKRTLAWTDATTSRFAPITALVLGIVLMLVLAVASGPVANWAEPILGGIVAGLYSQGLYSTAAKPVISATIGKAGA